MTSGLTDTEAMPATNTGRYQLNTADAFIGRNGNCTAVNACNGKGHYTELSKTLGEEAVIIKDAR